MWKKLLIPTRRRSHVLHSGLLRAALVAIGVGVLLTFGQIAVASEAHQGLLHVNYGDVKAAFNIDVNARHLPSIYGAPSDGARNGRAFAYAGESHHCELEWTSVNVTFAEEDSEFSRSEFEELVEAMTWVFHLNSIEHDHMSSTTKFYPFDAIWYKTKGFFIEPGELGIGFHRVDLYIFNPDGTVFRSGGHNREIVSHEEHLARLTAGDWFNHPD